MKSHISDYMVVSPNAMRKRVARGTAPLRSPGEWWCPVHPRTKLGFTEETQWPRYSTAHMEHCGRPSCIVFHDLRLILDCSL